MPPRPVRRELVPLLARAASAIRAVETGQLAPDDALALTVWPTDWILREESAVPFRTFESRIKASRTVYRAAGKPRKRKRV